MSGDKRTAMKNVTPLRALVCPTDGHPTPALPRPDAHEGRISMRDFDGLPVLIPVPRAAELLGISRASAYRYAEAGELPVKRLGGRIFVVRDRLRHFLEAA
jgi:excisionase family DNA binding protein